MFSALMTRMPRTYSTITAFIRDNAALARGITPAMRLKMTPITTNAAANGTRDVYKRQERHHLRPHERIHVAPQITREIVGGARRDRRILLAQVLDGVQRVEQKMQLDLR